jgi:acyl carrier protein
MTTVDSTAEVLAEVTTMIEILLADYALEENEITMSTTFHDDLELESVDLVTLADMIAQRYGSHVNLAEFFAEKDLSEVIALSVGQIVEYVVLCRSDAAAVGVDS